MVIAQRWRWRRSETISSPRSIRLAGSKRGFSEVWATARKIGRGSPKTFEGSPVKATLSGSNRPLGTNSLLWRAL